MVGTFGDVSAFSTMYRKNLAANSSGGMIFTKKYNTYKKIWLTQIEAKYYGMKN